MLSKKLYEEIVGTIAGSNLQESQSILEKKYPAISPMALGSIVGNYVQKKMKRTHASHNTSEQISSYYQRYCDAVKNNDSPGIIVRMAEEAELCPTLMARFVLEGYLRSEQQQLVMYQMKNEPKCTKSTDSSKPGSSVSVTRVPPINLMAIKAEVSRIMKDTTELDNPNLAYEVHLSTVYDSYYGPVPDAIKNTVGREYEQILEEKLTQLGIWFVDESELRTRGYDKTPDFKLELPIGIDGHVVNWIESKATFGDEETHKTYLDEQLISYKNRFGPGLVIYWLGYVNTLEDLNVSPSGVLVRENMPTNIIYMKPNGQMGNSPPAEKGERGK